MVRNMDKPLECLLPAEQFPEGTHLSPAAHVGHRAR
jgi:hypothetical protein